MRTETLTVPHAMRLRLLFDAARAGKVKAAADIYGFKVSARALLVEPVNGDPWIYVPHTRPDGSTDFTRDTMLTFESVPRSGTDHLRQRMRAQLKFEALA